MSTEIDDEELSFDDMNLEEMMATPVTTAKPEATPAPEADARPETPAKEPAKEEAAPVSETKGTPAAEAQPAPATPAKKRSLTGMAVAAGFVVCILTSTISAVQSWRAVSMVAEKSAAADSESLEARLNNIQKLLEQQRNALDRIATRSAASAGPADVSQINALATAVRANQEMSERLPSMIMQQVDSRLARVEARSRPVVRAAAKTSQSSAPKPKVVKAVAKAPVRNDALVEIKASQQAMQKRIEELNAQVNKRPAGEAIRYP